MGSAAADYDANFRYYSSSLGRLFQPDPVGGDPTNPQSWNRYAYALNSPVNVIDPLGLQGCPTNTPGGDYVRGNVPCYYTETWAPAPPDPQYDASIPNPNCPSGYVCVTVPNGPQSPINAPGGGGAVVSQGPPPRANNGSKTWSQILDCASEKANGLSLAGVIGTKHPIVNAFVGNTFSGLNDLRKDFSADNGNFAVDVIFGGAGQGLALRGGPATKGVAGIVTDVVVNAATKPGTIQTLSGVTQLGEEGLAGPIGAAKVLYDLATFLYGVGVCR